MVAAKPRPRPPTAKNALASSTPEIYSLRTLVLVLVLAHDGSRGHDYYQGSQRQQEALVESVATSTSSTLESVESAGAESPAELPTKETQKLPQYQRLTTPRA